VIIIIKYKLKKSSLEFLKVKIKFTLEQAMRAQKGSGGIALFSLT
jgi:hypothetical protein